MLHNNLKFTFRTLWNNRFFTALNILGLSVSLAAAWVVFQVVHYEYSYDSGHPTPERVYRVVSSYTSDGEENGNAGAPTPVVKAASEIAGVELAVPVFDRYYSNVIVPGFGGGSPRVFEEDIRQVVETDGRYFRMTPYTWLAGNPLTALDAPAQVVLTKSRAARYFPGLSPDQILGQTLLYKDTMRTTVTGVVADLPYPSTFEAKEMRSFSKPIPSEQDHWTGISSNQQVFVLLAPETDPQKVTEQINKISDDNSKAQLAKYGTTRRHSLQPLKTVHFDTQFGSHIRVANPRVLYGMIAVTGFLLLLAIINYINLATAQLPQRTREIGVRKTLGGQNSGLILQFLGETAVTTSISVLLAGLMARFFMLECKDFLPTDENFLDFVQYSTLAGFGLMLVAAVTLLSGFYPGWLMSRFQPVRLLRGQVAQSSKTGVRFRQGLIVFQFVVSQLLLIGALVVGQQMQFLLRQDLGFDREAIVIVDIPWKVMQKPDMKDKHFTLAGELKKLPEVAGISLGEQIFSNSYSYTTHKTINARGEVSEHNLNYRVVDTAALGLYKMQLLAGRNLLHSDTSREYVINETAVKTFGFESPQAAIGQILQENEGKSFPIVGVVRDFHMLSAHQKIEPIALLCDRSNQTTLNIKMTGSDPDLWQQGFRKMEAEWQKLYPGVPFKYQFYDEVLAEIYAEDRQMSSLANGTMAVALLISCLGLFGLSMFSILRRTKEIGVRKVLGASAARITSLLASDFIKLVLLAIVIASPLAYYFMQKWLANFAYRIDIQWWMFAASGLVAVAVAFFTVSFQSVKAALANPVKSLRSE